MKRTKPSEKEANSVQELETASPPAIEEEGRAMFSAASFFDVVGALPEGVSESALSSEPVPAPAEVLRVPAVVAFYGFRGGAGRTIAMAHVAALLTARGTRVCVVDLDLEAPGADAVFGVQKLDSNQGSVALLRAALTQPKDEPLPITPSLRSREISGRKLHILPAGRVDETYLAQIEELGVALWHLKEESPLSRLVRELAQTGPFDVIFLDCRTGFSAISASALFHISDLIVTFLPLSEQIWDGLEFLLKAVRTARFRRRRPAILLCPTMVPPGETGRRMLADFIPRLRTKYVEVLGHAPLDENAEDPEQPAEPILDEGVRYDVAIAEAGRLDLALQANSWKNYDGLADAVSQHIDLGASEPRAITTVDAKKILDEIQLKASWAFAEYVPNDVLTEQFVAPGNLAAAIDRSTTLILGAKGAGKTWLWRYLVVGGKGGSSPLPADTLFFIGHGSDPMAGGELQVSPDAFKELDQAAKMKVNGTYQAFWRLYSLARFSYAMPSLKAALLAGVSDAKRRKPFNNLLSATSAGQLQTALLELLKDESIGTVSEQLLRHVDEQLLHAEATITLAFDGLDTGFESGSPDKWIPRQVAFTTALLQVMVDVRARFRRLSFKVFLREDIFLRLSMQNQSHLEPATLELRWRPEDWWRIVLNIVCTSPTYFGILQTLRPGIGRPWQVDEQTLRKLLDPLWGERIETGRAAKTANYIQKRTADAQGRLFPRTLVQLLNAAMQAERTKDPLPNPSRVIRFTSLRDGVAKASKQRVEDVKKEYVELSPYLDALRGADATGNLDKFKSHMAKSVAVKQRKEGLHMGSGGWEKVVRRLEEVGVLGPYSGDKSKLAVALLYREGLGVKGVGI